MLKVHISLEPAKHIHGASDIIKYLLETNFIFNPKHVTGSAYTDQTKQWIQDSVKPPLEALFWYPILTIESMFHAGPRAYTKTFSLRVVWPTFK